MIPEWLFSYSFQGENFPKFFKIFRRIIEISTLYQLYSLYEHNSFSSKLFKDLEFHSTSNSSIPLKRTVIRGLLQILGNHGYTNGAKSINKHGTAVPAQE